MKKNQQFFKKNILLLTYFVLILIYALFSYALTDLNLILINNAVFLNFQNLMWQNVLPNTALRSTLFAIIIFALFLNYFLIIKNQKKLIINDEKKLFLYLMLLAIPLLFAYNALSYDLFNYIFNARILLKYQANPHFSVALDFPQDPWIRFMNNTHTAAPYGVAWTGLSVFPYLLGLGKFIFTWLNFKFFALLSFIFSFYFLSKLQKKETASRLLPLFLNPLLLIEVLGNAHNDLWMIWPVFLALLLAKQEKIGWKKITLIFLLMLISIYIKYASVVALPFICFLLFAKTIKSWGIFEKLINFFEKYFYELMALGFFLPLFTARSRQFLSWYLLWSLSFWPLLKSKYLKNILLIFSLTALFSYLPWLVYLPWMTYGQTTPDIVFLKKVFIWIIPSIYSLIYLGQSLFNRVSQKK